MPIVDRRFSQLHPIPTYEPNAPKELPLFFDKPALVILGDPGMGKTTSFEQAAQAEPNSVYVTVRDFLALKPKRWRGKILYLDGLDEQRAKADDGSSVLDRIRERLDELECPRFRLSCRAADWYGASDADSLRLVSSDGTVTVVMLEPLTEADIITIANEVVRDAEAFIEEARRRGIDELLVNPQTLHMILAVVSEGDWPQTRSELYQRACDILVRESNEEHRRVHMERTEADAIIDIAGYLSAILLCGGAAGFTLDEGKASADFPYIGRLQGEQSIFRIAVRRRLFRADGPERVIPAHRTLAEYLAARHIVRLVREGLPIGRVLALITGYDGGTLSDLRGLYAWLACLCPEHAGSLIPKDPIGIVLYGDTAVLPSDLKLMILDNLAKASKKNPWFREDWAARPFGGLCSPELEDSFRTILVDLKPHPVFVSCVLDAIRYGHPLPGLRASLLGIVRDDTRADYLRVEALDAFRHVCPGDTETLVELIGDIHSGRIKDEDRRLRGSVLRMLYPAVVRPSDVIKYIVADSKYMMAEYGRFVDFELMDATPAPDIPAVLDLIARSGLPCLDEDRHTGRRFIAHLLAKGLHLYGQEALPERLFEWLGIAVDKYDESILDRKEAQPVGDWLTSHPQVVKGLYIHWLSTTPRKNLWYEEHRFWRRLQGISPPEGFPRWQLEKAATETDDPVADFLFRKSVQSLTTTVREDSPTLDELLEYVDQHPKFKKSLDSELYDEIPDWRVEQANRKIEERKKKEKIRTANIQIFSEHLEEIRSGKGIGYLRHLSLVYFGRFADVNRDIPPTERLLMETGQEISSAARDGFIATLSRPTKIPSPKKISISQIQGKYFTFGYVVLAGMDLLAERSMARLMALPVATLQSALAFQYTNSTGDKRTWFDRLVTERSELAADALGQFWEPQLKKRLKHIFGIDDLDTKASMAEVAKRTAVRLLRKYPDCAEGNLKYLLRAAMKHADRQAFLYLARSVLKRSAAKGEQLTLWISSVFLISPEEFREKLSKHIGKNADKAWRVLGYVNPLLGEDGRSIVTLSKTALGDLIKSIGRTFSPQEKRKGDSGYRFNSEAHALKGLVARLRDDTGREAAEVLVGLYDDPALKAWREDLAHALDVQARKRREDRFHYPSVAEVVTTLRQGAPANASDLQALVSQHLQTIREDLVHGPTDGYKTFWNVDRYGTPTDPKPENDCRDRILDDLRPILSRVNVNAEPEGHYARNKRADIKVMFGPCNLPVEIKRHYHRNLWDAPVTQLQKLYSQDPGTGGRGIFLVLWFGADVKSVPSPPGGIPLPGSAHDLEEALGRAIFEQDKVAIDVIVFDCSAPGRTVKRKKGDSGSKRNSKEGQVKKTAGRR